MSMIERMLVIPADHEKNVFGQYDEHIKKIEKTLGVTVVSREGTVRVLGPEAAADRGERVLKSLLSLSENKTSITDQNVNYALALVMEEKEQQLAVIDSDIICHTINGRSVRPKTAEIITIN